MAILPEDVETKEFVVALRGYDKDEVHDFLKAVAEELRSLRAGGSQGADDDHLKDLGEQVARVLATAHDAARRLQEHAESKAAELIHAAEVEAASIRTEANREANKLRKKASKVWGQVRALPPEAPPGSPAALQEARLRAAHDRLAELHEEISQLTASCRDLIEVLRAASAEPAPPAAQSI